jgi:hypothetical protein
VSKESNDDRPQWTMTDAWVFSAIAYDGPSARHTLREVIGIADGINHDVLAEGEFSRAVGRLLSAELIEAEAGTDRYWPTEAGAKLRERWRHGLFGWIDAIPPQLQRLGEPRDTDWCLPHGVFDRAVRDYLAKWRSHA